jgi:hypothetical protein
MATLKAAKAYLKEGNNTIAGTRPRAPFDSSARLLVVQDHAEQAIMDHQPIAAVIDEAKVSEPIHEMTDPRPGCADYLSQVILTDTGKHGLCFAFLAKMSEHQENPSQALLARVEKKPVYKLKEYRTVSFDDVLQVKFNRRC